MKSYGDPRISLESIVPKEEEDEGLSWVSLIRVTAFLASMFAGIGVIYTILLLIVPKGLDILFDPAFQALSGFWVFGITMYFWGVVEKKTLPQMGLIPRWTDLIAGCAIGLSAILLLYGLELVINLVALTPPVNIPIWTIFQVLVVTLLVALLEEIVFRGYIFQTLLTDMPLPVAVGLSTFLYAQVHIIKPGRVHFIWPLIGYLIAGLVLTYAYLLTRNLLLPMGLQGAWILFVMLSDSLHLWQYPIPWLTGDGSPVCGLLGILTVGAIALALRYVYGSLDLEKWAYRRY